MYVIQATRISDSKLKSIIFSATREESKSQMNQREREEETERQVEGCIKRLQGEEKDFI